MKKFLIAFITCTPVFAMSNYESRLSSLESSMAEIKNVLEDKTDPDDPSGKILGIKSKVANNTRAVEAFGPSMTAISGSISSLSATLSTLYEQVVDMKITLTTLNTEFNEKLENAWELFVNQKFDEYMKVKKQVLDIITACKIKGDPTPTYIVETAEQLQALDLEIRRTALTDILKKLNVFDVLLDGEKIEILQNYLTNTNVPKPNIQEIGQIMSTAGIIIDGDYIKITGELRAFIRKTYLGSGVPHESWMDINYDYFGYKRLGEIKTRIKIENDQRIYRNKQIEYENAMAQAAYDAGIKAANRVAFPTIEFDSIVSDYNRLLTRHEI